MDEFKSSTEEFIESTLKYKVSVNIKFRHIKKVINKIKQLWKKEKEF